MKIFPLVMLALCLLACTTKSKPGSGLYDTKIPCAYDSITNSANGLFILIPDTDTTVNPDLYDKTANEYFTLDSLNSIDFSMVDSAYIEYVSAVDNYSMVMLLDKKGQSRFAQLTDRFRMGKMGLVLNGKLLVAAQIMARIDSPKVSIISEKSEDNVKCFTRAVLKRTRGVKSEE